MGGVFPIQNTAEVTDKEMLQTGCDQLFKAISLITGLAVPPPQPTRPPTYLSRTKLVETLVKVREEKQQTDRKVFSSTKDILRCPHGLHSCLNCRSARLSLQIKRLWKRSYKSRCQSAVISSATVMIWQNPSLPNLAIAREKCSPPCSHSPKVHLTCPR